jgi:hypothetical protein
MSAKNNMAGKVWYWRPGGIPMESTRKKKIPDDVTAFCHEGDKEWTPIERKPAQEKEPS